MALGGPDASAGGRPAGRCGPHLVHGAVHRISPESPVPVLSIRRSSATAGGAGNVALNIAALGGRWPLLAAVLVVVVAVLDGVDGAVAQLTDTSTSWGRVVDQLVDRVGDLSMVAGL